MLVARIRDRHASAIATRPRATLTRQQVRRQAPLPQMLDASGRARTARFSVIRRRNRHDDDMTAIRVLPDPAALADAAARHVVEHAQRPSTRAAASALPCQAARRRATCTCGLASPPARRPGRLGARARLLRRRALRPARRRAEQLPHGRGDAAQPRADPSRPGPPHARRAAARGGRRRLRAPSSATSSATSRRAST